MGGGGKESKDLRAREENQESKKKWKGWRERREKFQWVKLFYSTLGLGGGGGARYY